MKKLRLVTEELHASYVPNAFQRLNILYTDMSGNNPPCYTEFMNLMDCMSNKPTSECIPHYLKLIHCLRTQGFDTGKIEKDNEPPEDPNK